MDRPWRSSIKTGMRRRSAQASSLPAPHEAKSPIAITTSDSTTLAKSRVHLLFGEAVVIPRVGVEDGLMNDHTNLAAEAGHQAADEFDDRDLIVIQRGQSARQVASHGVVRRRVEVQLLLFSRH